MSTGCAVASKSWNTRPPIPTSGTTRPAPSGSPVSCLTPRASCGGSRSCGSASTTCRCSTRLAAEERAQAPTMRWPRPTPSCKQLREDIEAMEVRTLLSGEYDEREALVNIRSGAGGVDAADWAEMLMRMYIRWAEQHDYPVEVFDTSYAEEAGIKSATFAVHAPVRLRHVVGGAGHAPTGAHQPVRQPEPPPDVVRRSRGAAGRRRPPTTSTSPRPTCASTSTGPAGRVGSR